MEATIGTRSLVEPVDVWKGRSFVLLAAVAALVAVAADLRSTGGTTGIGDDWKSFSNAATTASAAFAGCALLWRYRLDSRADVRLLLGLGCCGWALSQFANVVASSPVAVEPRSEFIDLGYLLLPALVMVALVRHTRRMPGLARFVFWCDALMMSASLTFIVWELIIDPYLLDPTKASSLEQFFIVANPIADLLVVAALVLLMLIDVSPARLLTALAMGCLAIGDALQAASTGRTSVLHDHLVTASTVLAFVLLAVSARARRGASLGYDRPTISRLVVVHLPGAVAYSVAMIKYFALDRPVRTATTTIVAAVWGVSIVVSHYASWRLSSSLSDRLSANLARERATRGELRALLDDLPDAVVVADSSGRIHESNQRAAELTGMSAEQLRLIALPSLFRREDLRTAVAKWRADPEGKGSERTVFAFTDAVGTQRLLQIDARLPVRDSERMVLTLRDVTKKVR